MKQLQRSKTDRKLAGVCGGIAKFFDIDAVIVRIVFVILALPGGVPGVLLYLVLWVVMPEENTEIGTPPQT